MDAPVPGNIDKPCELAVFPRADPAQAVPAHLRLPVIVQDPMTETLSMQDVHLGVRERAAPRVIDHRATLRSGHAARPLGCAFWFACLQRAGVSAAAAARMRPSQSVRAWRAVWEIVACGKSASKPWNPPAQTCSSAWPPAAQIRVA
jgi:hypothetical protein